MASTTNEIDTTNKEPSQLLQETGMYVFMNEVTKLIHIF